MCILFVEFAHLRSHTCCIGSEDDDLDDQLRRDAAESCRELLEKSKLSDILIRQISWVRIM